MPSDVDQQEAKEEDKDHKEMELADEVMQGDKLVFRKIDINSERKIDKREAIIFFLFTFFFLFIIFTQLGIADSFLLNDAIRNSINNWEDNESFEGIQTLEDFSKFYEGYLDSIYREDFYNIEDVVEFNKTDEEKYTIKNFNYLVSTLRLTQRRMKLKNNDSPISKKYIPQVWEGDEITFDDKRESYEDTAQYGNSSNFTSQYTYNASYSYEGLGGFIIDINIRNTSYDDAMNIYSNTLNSSWLDDVTASLIMDYVVYNPYIDMILYTRLIVKAEPSGKLVTEVKTDALKRSYYSSALDYFRLVCECIFLIISIFYFIQKVFEIYEEYKEIKKQFNKDRKKKEFKKRQDKNKKNDESKTQRNDQSFNEEEDDENDISYFHKKDKNKYTCSKSCGDVMLG